ncbi:glycoside hydrolase family 18 protein [Peniophora sp. CONT]|nr:glycoside hydrolase family 18 protein [Peniophora sp. CONT]
MKYFSTFAALAAASLVGATPLASRSPSTLNSSTTSLDIDTASSSPIVASWIQGWHTTNDTLDKLSFSKYTHMTYGFAEPLNDFSLDLSKSNPDSLAHFVELAKQNNVKSLLSLGGWYGSRSISTLVATQEGRESFVRSIILLASDRGVDGIEFDWEYPNEVGACNVHNTADTANLVALVKMLRNGTVGRDLILTSTVSGALWQGTQANNDSQIVELAENLDYISIMNYDVFGYFSAFAGPNAPLDDSCATKEQMNAGSSATSAVKRWNEAGVPLNKLVLGIPTYGHSFIVSSENATRDGFKSLNTHPGFDATKHPLGSQDHDTTPTGNDICGVPNVASGAWDFAGLVSAGYIDASGTPQNKTGTYWMFDSCSQTPMLYDESNKLWITYDDPQSFRAKGEFVKTQGLRGFAAFEAYGDVNDVMLDAVRSGAGLS